VKEADKIMAEAIRIVQGLYKDGLLKKPDNWTMAPHLLQFYEQRAVFEQDLYVMFLEYRIADFSGRVPHDPDYITGMAGRP